MEQGNGTHAEKKKQHKTGLESTKDGNERKEIMEGKQGCEEKAEDNDHKTNNHIF